MFSAKCFKHSPKIIYNTKEGVLTKIPELQLSTVNEWLTKETESTVKSLKSDAKTILDEVKSRLDELYDASEKLLEDAEKEMARGSRKTFRRAKFLFKLAGTFSDLIDKVVIPDEINGKTLKETSEQLTKAMETINQEKTKWFRALAPYFILSRRKFDASYKRTEEPYKRLMSFLSNDFEKVERIENFPSKIDELNQNLFELNNYKKNKQARAEKHENLEKQIVAVEQQLQALQNKGELVELAELESKIKKVTEEVKQELRHLQKPLLKFQTLVNNPGYSLAPDANSKLEQYLVNPFEALATEKEGYILLKKILQRINKALDNKKMKLKPSRLRKAKDQINRITNNDVLNSFWSECNKLFYQKRELISSGAIGDCKDKNAELRDSLKDLKTKKRLLAAKDERLAKEFQDIHERVVEQKKELEQILVSVVNQNVSIIFTN